MSDQELSIFEDETAMAEAPEPEQQEEAAPEPEQEAAPEPEQAEASDTGEEEAAPPVAAPEPEPTTVPIQAILDEREKRQESQRAAEAARAEAARYQAQIRQMQEAQRQPAPDWDMDPAAAASHQMQSFQQQMQAQALKQSRFFAEREFGADLVNEAYAFFDQNPHLSQQLMNEASPFHAAVEFYQKQKLLSEIGSDPEAYKAKLREEVRAEMATEMQAAQPKPTPTPPRSLSSAPAGGKLDAIAVDAPPQLNALFNG